MHEAVHADAHQDAMLRALDRVGEIVFIDDEKDFGRFSFEGHPSPFHHWQVGLALRGAAGLMRTVLELEEFFGDAPQPVEVRFAYPASNGGPDILSQVHQIFGGR